MATDVHAAVESQSGTQAPLVVNDMVIEVATANGSGSASANMVLTRAIFQMGVPVSAKNIFPSNIQGLPTWFVIRANGKGWTAYRENTDLMVCMNKKSVEQDLANLRPGVTVVMNEDLKGFVQRDDLHVVAAPFAKLVKPLTREVPKLGRLMINMMYVGVVAWLLDIELDEVDRAIDKQFSRKPKAADLNKQVARAGYDWAGENTQRLSPHRIERMSGMTEGKILIDGNTACALGAIWGGCSVIAWYPITPSSSLAESAIDYMKELRHDPETGKATYAIIQAEDELASIGIVAGAGWAGARAMTATSGPGISLMSEIAGLCYFAEIPAVIVDVQRLGPSTGLPTRTSQGDILKAFYLSHGDCKHLLLIPGSMHEAFHFTCEAFNLAERYQTLVFVMTDLDMGMNQWMSEPFTAPTEPINRGKVLTEQDVEQLENFARYRDVDGDGIAYRTLPGTEHPNAAYFTRGTGHTDRATYSEDPRHWVENLDRLSRKFETAHMEMPTPVVHTMDGATFGIIAYGTSDAAVLEAMETLDREYGLSANYLRIRALPPHDDVYAFLEDHPIVYIVDQNRDGQMATVLKTFRPDLAYKMYYVRHYNGLPITSRVVVEKIVAFELGPEPQPMEQPQEERV